MDTRIFPKSGWCKIHVWIEMDPLPNTKRIREKDFSLPTCIHIVGPTAGLRAASSRRGTAWVEDIIHRALHLTVINGLPLVGAATTMTTRGEWKDEVSDFFLLVNWLCFSAMRFCTVRHVRVKWSKSRFQSSAVGRGLNGTVGQIWIQICG